MPCGRTLRENGRESGWRLGARASRPRGAWRWESGRKRPCCPRTSHPEQIKKKCGRKSGRAQLRPGLVFRPCTRPRQSAALPKRLQYFLNLSSGAAGSRTSESRAMVVQKVFQGGGILPRRLAKSMARLKAAPPRGILLVRFKFFCSFPEVFHHMVARKRDPWRAPRGWALLQRRRGTRTKVEPDSRSNCFSMSRMDLDSSFSCLRSPLARQYSRKAVNQANSSWGCIVSGIS